jgi:undecaprenyl-diphosphatase
VNDLVGALILAVVQGITEFLPISSDGHLALAHAVVGFETDNNLFFDLLLHLGTLIAVVFVFWREIADAARSAWRGLLAVQHVGWNGALEAHEGLRLAMLVAIAMVPTAIIGIGVKELLERYEFSLLAIGGLLFVNGAILALARFAPKHDPTPAPLSWHGVGARDIVLIGIAQGLATLPGISRSGSTIVTGLLLGAERAHVARLSFLMAIPAIVGAFIVQSRDVHFAGVADDLPIYLLAASVSALVGVVALRTLLRLLERAQFHHFAWYCFGLGSITMAWALFAGA